MRGDFSLLKKWRKTYADPTRGKLYNIMGLKPVNVKQDTWGWLYIESHCFKGFIAGSLKKYRNIGKGR